MRVILYSLLVGQLIHHLELYPEAGLYPNINPLLIESSHYRDMVAYGIRKQERCGAGNQ